MAQAEKLPPLCGIKLATSAFHAGLATTHVETGELAPVPLSLNPLLFSTTKLDKYRTLAQRLLRAGMKMAYAAHGAPPDCIARALSPLEARLMRQAPRVLATARVDCWPSPEALWALELNATIPAMQAYSDIAAAQTIAAHGQRLGLHPQAIAQLQELNGSNTRALWEALLAAYACFRPNQQPERLGILCRRHDAQHTELLYVQRAFSRFGLPTELLYPDQLENKEGFWANGKHYPLVYRHLFVSRLEDNAPGHALLQRLLAQPNGPDAPTLLFNPPAAPLEVKATFALLSESMENEALAQRAQLDNAEKEAIAALVPWTRLFNQPAALQRALEAPDNCVLKKNWSYGGKAVFIGKTRFEADFAQRTERVFGEPLSWESLCQRAFNCPDGGYVLQEAVDNAPQRHCLCMPSGVRSLPLYVDFSVYASVGCPSLPPWGAVCRGSASRVVNVLGGGGLIPLLREEVAQQLQLGNTAYALPHLV